MSAALLEAAQAGRWNHWREVVATYPSTEQCTYIYRGWRVWGYYARNLPFGRWRLSHVVVVYDPVAQEIIHDGLEWALQKLDGQVPQAILDEIAELDERLQAKAKYLVNTLDVYGAIGRDQPKSHWWWYLDELLAQQEEVPAPEQAPVLQRTPALALHEEAAEYTPPEAPGRASTIPADEDRIE